MDIESNKRRKRAGNVIFSNNFLDDDPLADTASEHLGSSDRSNGDAGSSQSGDEAADGLNLYFADNGSLGGAGNANKKFEGTTNRVIRRRRKVCRALFVLFLVVIIISIVVGVVVSNNKSSNSDDNDNAESVNSENKTVPPESTDDNSVNNATEATSNQNATEVPKDEDGDGDDDDDDDNFVMPYLDDTEGVVTFSSDVGPFTVEVPTLASTDIGVYEDERQVSDGLTRMALFLHNNVVNRINGKLGFGNVGHGGGFPSSNSDSRDGVSEGTEKPPAKIEIEDPAMDKGVSGDMNSYKSNNQEKIVDRADVAKSDGIFIYAAYGNKLLVFRTDTEELVLKLELPPSECLPPERTLYDASMPSEDADNNTDARDEGHDDYFESIPGNLTTEDDSEIAAPYFDCPTPWIESILLGDSRLVLVVSGYGHEFRGDYAGVPVLSELLSTQIRLYSTEALLKSNGGLSLLGTENLNGYYREGFVVNQTGIAHIATYSSLNTRAWLVNPIEDIRAEHNNLTKKEFADAIRSERQELVGSFVTQLVSELSITKRELPRIAKLRLPIDTSSNVKGLENVLFAEGYANSIVQITSFHMNPERRLMPASNEIEGEIELQQTVQFLPNAWAEIFATEEMIIVAGQGYDFHRGQDASEDMTILYAFDVDGTMATPLANGKVPGSLLNRYSLDYVDGYFRVATTTRSLKVDEILQVKDESSAPTNNSDVGDKENSVGEGEAESNGEGGNPAAGLGPPIVDEEEAGFESDASDGNVGGNLERIRTLERSRLFEQNRTGFVFVTKCPSLDAIGDDECYNNQTQLSCIEMKDSACETIGYWKSTCPYEIQCIDDFSESQCPMPSPDDVNPCLTTKNVRKCLRLEERGCEDIITLESCPLQFRCAGGIAECMPNDPECIEDEEDDELPPDIQPESRTRNGIFVLQPPQEDSNSTSMEIVGNVTLGRPNEGTINK